MTDMLSDRMEKIEQALRDLEVVNQQLVGLLTRAIKSGAVATEARYEPSAAEPRSKVAQSTATHILTILAQADQPKSRPPKQGLGQRLQEHMKRKAEEDAALLGKPAPSP